MVLDPKTSADMHCRRESCCVAWMARASIMILPLVVGSTTRVTGYVLRPRMFEQKGPWRARQTTGTSTQYITNGAFVESKSNSPVALSKFRRLPMMAVASLDEDKADSPQVWASSISTARELGPAISEVAAKALTQLPQGASIDLALVHVSSVYGNAERLEKVVPELRKALPGLGAVIGCSTAGVVGMKGKGHSVEVENRACVGLTLATLPGVKVRPFYLDSMDIPDPLDPPGAWRRAVKTEQWGGDSAAGAGGLTGEGGAEEGVGEPIFILYATAQSIDALGDYMAGMDAVFPRSGKIGAIASTVSSLTKSCVFFGESGKSGTVEEHNSYYREGMVGISLAGDIRMRTFISQGARRVGPTFHADEVDGPIVKTLRVAERGVDGEGQDDWISPALPPLAMIKQVQKRLSAADQRLVQENMLIGIAPELVGDTPGEVRDISTGVGKRFVVQGTVR